MGMKKKKNLSEKNKRKQKLRLKGNLNPLVDFKMAFSAYNAS